VDAASRKMNLSIKALLPEPERRPRNQRNNEDGEDNHRKFRSSRRNDDEISTWSEGSISGTSIADLLASAKKNK